MDARILLVEDDADLSEAMAAALVADGHRVDVAGDGHRALEAVAATAHQVVLLDVALGAGPDGVEVCRRVRRLDADVYVMMLTARDTEADVVLALEAGADDYVTKPVGVVELRSRVRAALRRLARPRAHATDAAAPILRHERIVVEPTAHRALVETIEPTLGRADPDSTGRPDPVPLALTRSEYAVLEALLRAEGAVRSRSELLHAIYGDDAYRDPHAVDVHIHYLRDKLERAGGDPRWLVTVRGIGYRVGA